MGLYENIKEFLDENKVEYEEYDHPAAWTSEAAVKARGEALQQAVKAMVMRSKGKFYMFALRAHKMINWKKARAIMKTNSLSLATPEEVKQVMGVEIGACAPFGNLVGIPTFADKSVFEAESFVFSCGKHDKSIEIMTKDWERLVKPIRAEFS